MDVPRKQRAHTRRYDADEGTKGHAGSVLWRAHQHRVEQVGAGEAALEYIQFEYRFVLNDTIPLIVVDVNGPSKGGWLL